MSQAVFLPAPVRPLAAELRTMATIYVSGSYSAPTPAGVEGHIRAAKAWTTYLLELGYAPICPHTNTPEIGWLGYEDIMAVDFALLALCCGIFMLPDWKKSPGAVREQAFAVLTGIPVFETVEALLASPLARQPLPFQPRG